MLREQFGADDQKAPSVLLLKGIDNGTRRLGEIIDDMVDVSMIDNNMLALNFQPTWINRLLDVLQKEIESLTSERNLTLEINEFPGYDEMTFADSERLYQALRNVVTNAIKYTPDGGRVIVDGRKLAGFIEITVTDTGIGIDPDDLDRIFEKFGRIGNVSLHSSGKTKFKGGGPGLGLPIAKGILDAHGGTIWAESEGFDEEKCPGATFHILVPLHEEPPDERASNLFQPLSDATVHDVNPESD
jgi:signal transduction histidine kinase